MRVFFLFCALLLSPASFAWDQFHSEADPTLKTDNIWTQTTFKKNDHAIRSAFRVWYPAKPQILWKVLTDTNLWKEIHSDYKDSQTLDKQRYDLVAEEKPHDIKAYHDIVGNAQFPSDYGRIPGGIWMSYDMQEFNFPWPFADRWAVMKVKNDESDAKKGVYHYEYKMVAGNFRESRGYWEILPLPDKPGWSEFRGEYRADPGIETPQFLTRALFKSSLKKAREENLKELEKK